MTCWPTISDTDIKHISCQLLLLLSYFKAETAFLSHSCSCSPYVAKGLYTYILYSEFDFFKGQAKRTTKLAMNITLI